MILYESTRGSKEFKTGAQAVIQGIAEDRGLYVPHEVPALPMQPEDMVGMTYKQVAFEIIKTFFDDYTDEEMKYCTDGAYDSKFEEKEIVPVAKAGGAYFLELYHGKTAAFKDMALSILPYLLTTATKKENEDKKICILTATSGDTGKAALEGFADVPGTEIIVFFPNKGVSQVQERQMITQEGANTHVFAIEGNFDDAQTGVKKIFNDDAFAEKLAGMGCKLSSANSINIGRLVPQVAYYVWGYVKLVERGVVKAGDPVNICVPTGNFGNILAAYYAGEMGIPVNRFICASNKNRVLTDFFNTGVYNTNREFYLTNSPSMDILISSNLERLVYQAAGEDADATRSYMQQLSENGSYEITDLMRAALKDFWSDYASEEQTSEEIRRLYDTAGYVIDPHTAVASEVYRRYREETGDGTKTVIASTASPYKFLRSVATSIQPELSGMSDFELIDELHRISGVDIPQAIEDIRTAPQLHSTVTEVADMPAEVLRWLGI